MQYSMEFIFLMSYLIVLLPFGYQMVYRVRAIYLTTKKSILNVLITSLGLQFVLTCVAFFLGALSFKGECGLPVFGIIGLGMMFTVAIIITAIIQFMIASLFRYKSRL